MSKPIICPHCTNRDDSMMEKVYERDGNKVMLCAVCSKTFVVEKEKEK